MPTERKSHDIVLPEVRKPAGYGALVSVIDVEPTKRELWFQHLEDPAIVRCVVVDISEGRADKPLTIKTRGERARD